MSFFAQADSELEPVDFTDCPECGHDNDNLDEPKFFCDAISEGDKHCLCEYYGSSILFEEMCEGCQYNDESQDSGENTIH